MKRAIIIIFLFLSSLSISAQSAWTGFFFPVKDNPLVRMSQVKTFTTDMNLKLAADSSYIIKLFRFSWDVSGTEVMYNKATKSIEPQVYFKTGPGLNLSFFRVKNGTAYNYLSVGAFAFLPATDSNLDLSFGLGLSAFDLFGVDGLSPQFGLDFTPALIKSDYFPVGLVVGITYKIN